MKTILNFSIAIFLLMSCKSDDNLPNCNFENPIEDLAWLKEKTIELQNSIHQQIIDKGTYKNQTVFILGTCCAACNYVVPVYDCKGNKLGIIGSQEGNIASNDLKNIKELWRSKEDCS